MKREAWTIEDLPKGHIPEDDRFDRKAYPTSESDLKTFLGKSLSAFANSGGGPLFIGVEDDGTLSGCPRLPKGKQEAKDWFEQLVIAALEPPLQSFRVHQIPLPHNDSKVVVVIDIGDSEQAPHQSITPRNYFYRASGHSLPAPHFYLELLRSRTTRPRLRASNHRLLPVAIWEHPESCVLWCVLNCDIHNDGNVMARHAAARHTQQESTDHTVAIPISFDQDSLPSSAPRLTPDRRMASIILPGGWHRISQHMALHLPPVLKSGPRNDLIPIGAELLSGDIICRLVAENFVGEPLRIPLTSLVSTKSLARRLAWLSARAYSDSEGYAGWGLGYKELNLMNYAGGRVALDVVIHNISDYDYDTIELDLLRLDKDGRCIGNLDAGIARLRSHNQSLYEHSFKPLEVTPAFRYAVAVRAVSPRPDHALAGEEEFEQHTMNVS